jgi:Tfp pilus assembly protein PilN
MPLLSGIVATEDGRFVMASLRKKKSGAYHCSINRWSMRNKIRTIFLFNRSVCCGVPSFWQPATSIIPGNRISAGADGDFFRPIANTIDADLQKNALSNNISALVPDNTFLCEVPLLFADRPQSSFISVYFAKNGVSIGVVIDKKLVVVFNMAAEKITLLESHLGRIKRYWAKVYPTGAFPEHVYIINSKDKFEFQDFSIHHIAIKFGDMTLNADEEIRALGCALSGQTGNIPAFQISSIDYLSRVLRSAIIIGSAAIILISALFTLTPAILFKITETRLHYLEAKYRSGIMENREIRDLAGRNDSLAKDILSLQAKFSKQTRWSGFLETIGKNRPNGLFLEKLGSEPVASSSSKIRIAISGSAENETLVTDFIARLQKDELVSGVSLSFLEKNEKNKKICNFRIICLINIINN